jgi:hypothetical protein
LIASLNTVFQLNGLVSSSSSYSSKISSFTLLFLTEITEEVDSSLPLPITNLDGLSPKAVNPSSKSSLLIVFSVL